MRLAIFIQPPDFIFSARKATLSRMPEAFKDAATRE
jgi:hypothetical protein